jgi:outer membrane biosynthesis protein TonB
MTLELLKSDGKASRRRLKTAFGVSAVVHALIFGWIAFGPKPVKDDITITEVAWLDAKDLEPPKPAPKPEPPKPVAKPTPPAPKPAPVQVAKPAPEKPKATPKAASAPKPPDAVPKGKQTVHEPAGASGVAARGAAPSGGGEKGRAEGARVAANVRQTTANVDRLLAGITGDIAVGTPSGDKGAGGGKPSNARYQVAGGRGAGNLPSVEGDLRGTGLGEVGAGSGAGGGKGPGRGVARAGVDIVDDGVESAGDGATASGRDSRSLMAVVQRYVAGIKFCYDNALKKSPNLTGKITLQMDIAASGSVGGLTPLDDSMGNAALQRCILAQVQGWKFPAIEAGTVRFTLPLVFSPPQTSGG